MRWQIRFNRMSTLLLCVYLSTICFSCKKFVEIEPAPNLIESNGVFEDDKTATSAILNVYSNMRSSATPFTNANMSIFCGLSADEIYNTAPSSTNDPFTNNTILSNNGTISLTFWQAAYRNIYRINANIEGLMNSNFLTDSLRKQLLGEMKFARAWYFFNLVNLFGDVPLTITTNYQVNAIMPRTPVIQVYHQIIDDLIDAQSLLKSEYPTSGRVRPNKWTATALLARAYLYQKEWANAEAQSSAIINAPGYSLASITSVFLASSSETIWEIASLNEGSNTVQGSTFITAQNVRPTFAITTNLLGAFENGDARKLKWLDTSRATVLYYYPKKYKEKTASTPVKEYNIVFRLAEQFLIRAEARIHQSNILGAQADINMIRTRAGLGNTTANTEPSILSAIEKERQVELFTEWGDRWLNLKRIERIDAVLSNFKGSNWQSTDALYPIPFSELQLNVFLTQNPGY